MKNDRYPMSPMLLLCAGAALLGGCVPTQTLDSRPYEGMIPAYTAANRSVRSVRVEVMGGTQGKAATISDAEFRRALTDTIVMSRLFSRVVAEGGDYVLSIELNGVEQPEHALTSYWYTAKLSAGWTLKRSGGNAPVWTATIRSEHTSTPSDGLERARIATDGAARENIAAGLAHIEKLDL